MGSKSAWVAAKLIFFSVTQLHATISLTQVLADVLADHPELKSTEAATRAAYADTLQSNLPTNPELGVSHFREIQGSKYAQFLSITYPWQRGLVKANQAVAYAHGKAALGQEKVLGKDFELEIRILYVKLQAENFRRHLQDSITQAWATLVPIANGAAAGGRLSVLESGQVRLEAAKASRESAERGSQQKILAATLEYYTGYPIAFDSLTALSQDAFFTSSRDDSAWDLSLHGNATLQALDVEIKAYEAEVELENVRNRLEIGWTVGYEKDAEGRHLLGAELRFPLKIFNRNQSNIAKARFAVERSRFERDAAMRKLKSETLELLLQVKAAASALKEYATQIRPLLQSQSRLAHNAFIEGRLGVFELTRIQEEAAKSELAAVDKWEEYQVFLSRLNLLTGVIL